MVYKQDRISSSSPRSHILASESPPTAGQSSRSKKAKHKKDKDAKKPCNCFILYRSDFIKWHSQQLSEQPEEAQKQSGEDSKAEPAPPKMQDLSVLAGKTWRAMSEAEKSEYKDRARAIVDGLPRDPSSSTPIAEYSKTKRSNSSSKGSIRTKQSKTSKNANHRTPSSKIPSKSVSFSRMQSVLPSPPMSDSLPDSDVVGHSPCSSATHFSSRSSKSSLNHQLLTPSSTAAVVSMSHSGHTSSMPTFSTYASPSDTYAAQFAPTDVIRMQSRREFLGSPSLAQEHTHYYAQQVAMGYSYADHINNNIMDWTETDIRPTFY